MNCNIINDILPLYVDGVVSEDTKNAVEEHLATCSDCSNKLQRLKIELESEIREQAAQAEKKALLAAKKKLRKKRIITALISACVAFVILVIGVFILRNIRIPIDYKEENFKVKIEREYDEDWLYLYYDGMISGHNQLGVLDETGTKEQMYIEMYTTPWDELFSANKRSDKNRICVVADLNDPHEQITELRLITGDIRMMYEPSRDYDKLMESSILLWKNPTTEEE